MELVKQNVSVSEGRGYGEAEVRGCRLRAKSANPSPTRRGGSPLSRKRARAVVNRFFRDQNVQAPAADLKVRQPCIANPDAEPRGQISNRQW